MLSVIEILLLFVLCGFILGILVLVLLYFLWWRDRTAAGQGEQPPDPFEPPIPHPDYPTDEYFIQNQVIAAGSAATLNELPGLIAASEHQVELTELDRLDYGAILPELNGRCPSVPADLVIIKYKIAGEQASVFRAVRVIDEVMGENAGLVIKEPNWVTGQPYEIEGAPYEIEGAPYEIEGAGGGFSALDIDPQLFMEQWALKTIGLTGASLKGYQNGANVAVGIFDSAPYLINADQANLQLSKSVPLNADREPMALQVSRVFSPNEIGELPGDDHVNTADQEALKQYARSNHGLFVTGLIHAVAPDSQPYLYRVLDSHNRGDLFLLLKGIYQFTRDVIANPELEKVGHVLNMSLVVRAAPPEANFGLTSDLLSLNYALEVANCLNAVTVSAAGNSSGKSRIPRPASVPAGMAGVIAVAANNLDLDRSCFSNCGNVAAPGGDGRALTQPGDGDCKPRVDECSAGDCPAALIGPALKPPFNNDNDVEFVLWSGSSFAAPLTSGLAALVVGTGSGRFSPARVRKFIECGAIHRDDYALGAGIIQVPSTLAACEEALRAAERAAEEEGETPSENN
ncbi:MAG: S8/S53 family peptidase [Anaerolineales bacterium]